MAWSKEVFSKNLIYYMNRKGVNQKELADIVGVSAPTVSEWISSKKYPRIDKIEIMANYFGILKSDLIEDKSEDRKRMQEKNDILTDIVIRMRTDPDFLFLVQKLNNLDGDQIRGVSQMLSTFIK